MSQDPFGTAGLRATVLRAWNDSPARFREDANAEEALALGGYAGRALVELIANGVDAADGAGRVLVRWIDGPDGAELRVANVGRPLTRDGVAALASLRASAKRQGRSVGHFGVGFTAVLTVAERVEVHSRAGGAALVFDRSAAAAAVAELDNPLLAEEVESRAGAVPVLRLPFPIAVRQVPDGYETEVVLAVLPDRRQTALDQFTALGPDLLWALPGLTELTVTGPTGTRWWRRDAGADTVAVLRSSDGDSRWAVAHTDGTLDPALLADRPIEERDRSGWWITWVRPLPEDSPSADALSFDDRSRGETNSFIGAPLPTDEPLTLPARLFGTFPVDDTRRRLAAGPLTEHLLERAARCYLDLIAAADPADRIGLIPGEAFPAGPVDGSLTAQILDLLHHRPLWDTVGGDRLAGPDLRWIAGVAEQAVVLLSEAQPGLLTAPVAAADRAALTRIGARSLELSAAVAELAVLDPAPTFWGQVYAALADAAADDLAAVPVPLAGGGRRIGPRAVLVPEAELEADLAVRVGRLVPELPLVHPAAAHPALRRWGARPATAADLLAAAALQQRLREFRELLDEVDPDPDELIELAEVVLDLLAHDPGDRSVADLVLTDDTGTPWPAVELLQPDAPLRAVLDPAESDERPDVEQRWTRWPAEVLDRAGVRSGFGVLTVDRTEDLDALVADGQEWLDQADPAPDESLLLISDLDLVADDRWPAALELIGADRRTRAALLTPVGGGPSQAAWWLRRHARPGGRPVGQWRRPAGTELAGVCEPFPFPIDDEVAAAIGVSQTWADLLREQPSFLVERWADPDLTLTPVQVRAATAAVRTALTESDAIGLPVRLRAADGGVVSADRALVVDQPWPVAVLPPGRLVLGGDDPVGWAEVLEVDLISDLEFEVVVDRTSPVPTEILDRACAAAGIDAAPELRCGRIRVTVSLGGTVSDDGTVSLDGTIDADLQAVSWWPVDGTWWTDGSPAGLGSVVAWTAGRWADRHRIIAAAAGDWPDPTADLT